MYNGRRHVMNAFAGYRIPIAFMGLVFSAMCG